MGGTVRVCAVRSNLYRGNGVKNIEVIFYKDARHEVLNELDRLETFGDISRWLETHLAARAARQAVEQEQETACGIKNETSLQNA